MAPTLASPTASNDQLSSARLPPTAAAAFAADPTTTDFPAQRRGLLRASSCSVLPLHHRVQRQDKASPYSSNEAPAALGGSCRVKICYTDDVLCQRSKANLMSLLRTAQGTDGKDASSTAEPSSSTLLARRVLKYRKLLGRVQNANLQDPSFDLDAFTGIQWCRVQRTPVTAQ